MTESRREVNFPFRMFPNTKLLEDMELDESERIPSETSAKIKWNMEFVPL